MSATMGKKSLIQCPDCEGGKIVGMSPRYVEGVTGPPAIVLDCDRCNGTGQIPAAMMEWIEIGNQCRILREIASRDMSRCQCCGQAGRLSMGSSVMFGRADCHGGNRQIVNSVM